MKNAAALILASLFLGIAPAPQASWPMYQYSPSHNAVFAKPGFRVTWVAELGGSINGGLAVVGNAIYVDSFDHYLYALDANTGSIRWRARANNLLMSTPVVANGAVIVGSGHNGFLESDATAQMWGRAEGDDVYAFDARSGALLWSKHTVGEDMASPAIRAGDLVFANGDMHAYSLRLSDGAQLWRDSLPGVDTMASTTIAGESAFISVCHNSPHFRQTVAIDVRTGRALWTNPNGSCDASPAVDRGIVLVDGNNEDVKSGYDPGGHDIIAALDERTGRTLWQRVSPSGPYTIVASGEHAIAGAAVSGVLYQSIVNRDEVVALDERTGRVLWRAGTAAPVKMSPVITQTHVIFGDTVGLLYTVDRKTGVVLRTSAFKYAFSTSPPVIVGDTLFVANGRYVFAIPLDVI